MLPRPPPAGAGSGYRAAVTSELPRAAERTAALLDLLDLAGGDGPDSFVAKSTRHTSSRVFGGQVLAQALLAAGRTVPEGRRPHSLHGYFLRPGDLDQPIELAVERLRDGRSFSARRVQAVQDGSPILSMIASFELPADGLDHSDVMPEAPEPTSLPSLADVYGTIDNDAARHWAFEQPLDLRFVSPSIFVTAQDPPGADSVVWWRLPAEIAADPLLHAAVATFASDYGILEPVLRAHGRSWLASGLSIASIDHALWFHRPFRADKWLLTVTHSPSAAASRGLNTARMFSSDGRLVISVAQEGLYRERR